MNRNRERIARIFLALLLAGLVVGVFLLWRRGEPAILVRARLPENGGWSPAALTVPAGIPLHLRLTSDDVVHGFAVGQTDLTPVVVIPGEISEVTLTFKTPGKYTYYCTRWCGPDHWRMRGTIEVLANGASMVERSRYLPPLYQQLGLDIDAPHPAAITPAGRPAAAAGHALLRQLPDRFLASGYYRSHSPADAWKELKNEPLGEKLTDPQLWSLVAAIWQGNADSETLAEGETLYTRNCAACHGERGDGRGVLAGAVNREILTTESGLAPAIAWPADFTEAGNMLGASPALLQGKILRGGMGTGMPYWGPIFTEEQTWAIVAYLWTFQFEYEREGNQ